MHYEFFETSLLQFLLLCLTTICMAISYKLLNFVDLSIESSFLTAAAIFAILLKSHGEINFVFFVLAILGGFIIGLLNSFISLKFSINSILSSIVLNEAMIGLNLQMLKFPNLTIQKELENGFLFSELNIIVILITMIGFLCLIISYFLKTEIGLKFQAIGKSRVFAQKYGFNIKKYVCLGIGFCGAIAGCAGMLFSISQTYVDINMGNATALNAIAAFIMGEKICMKLTNNPLICALVGAFIFQSLNGFLIYFGLSSSILKILTSIIILILMMQRQKINIGPFSKMFHLRK